VVTDGFTGNIALKTAMEGNRQAHLGSELRAALTGSDDVGKLGALMARSGDSAEIPRSKLSPDACGAACSASTGWS
jgi:fatty acid/phospholipid biosynthesis enzyme